MSVTRKQTVVQRLDTFWHAVNVGYAATGIEVDGETITTTKTNITFLEENGIIS